MNLILARKILVHSIGNTNRLFYYFAYVKKKCSDVKIIAHEKSSI